MPRLLAAALAGSARIPLASGIKQLLPASPRALPPREPSHVRRFTPPLAPPRLAVHGLWWGGNPVCRVGRRPAPLNLALAASDRAAGRALGKPLFVQISDTHIGFNKDANPDVVGTLTQTIDLVNGMPRAAGA